MKTPTDVSTISQDSCNNILINKDTPNRRKGKVLESATRLALIELKLKFKDLSNFYNGECYEWISLGTKPKNKRVADFETSNFVIEDKNWNCVKYYVDFDKAINEIAFRFLNSHPSKKKITIISNPKWIRGVKEMLSSSVRIHIIELGFFVTWNNFTKAVYIIKKHLRKLCWEAASHVNYSNNLSRLCSYFNNKLINKYIEIIKTRLVSPKKYAKQRYKRRKQFSFLRKFFSLIANKLPFSRYKKYVRTYNLPKVNLKRCKR